ncbi:MAG: hypothetical protein JW927_04660 [Deltaproteobacteria bacterium]|nr:hypothetical protein [Deltaproteobacteria bacterium]
MELQEALKPISSLISKSEKAQQKLEPETWQYKMLRDNLKALRYAAALITGDTQNKNEFTQGELHEALHADSSMISKVEKTQTKLLQGTSHHTLQQNRLNALRIMQSLIKKEMHLRYSS